jgi:hypothetical protein
VGAGPEPLIARLARLLAVHDLGGNVPAQLAAAELVPRLDELSARQAPARQARHDHLRAELALHLTRLERAPGARRSDPVCAPAVRRRDLVRADRAASPRCDPAGSSLDASGQSQDYLRLHFVARADDLTEAVK